MIEVNQQTTHQIILTLTDAELYDFICLIEIGLNSRSKCVKRASERLQSISSLLDRQAEAITPDKEVTPDVDR